MHACVSSLSLCLQSNVYQHVRGPAPVCALCVFCQVSEESRAGFAEVSACLRAAASCLQLDVVGFTSGAKDSGKERSGHVFDVRLCGRVTKGANAIGVDAAEHRESKRDVREIAEDRGSLCV